MSKCNWKVTSLTIAIPVMLALVLNPELRAFLLILDFLGADLLLLLLGGYFYYYGAILTLYLYPALTWMVWAVKAGLKSLRWMAYGLHPRDGQWAQIDHIRIASGAVAHIGWGRRSG